MAVQLWHPLQLVQQPFCAWKWSCQRRGRNRVRTHDFLPLLGFCSFPFPLFPFRSSFSVDLSLVFFCFLALAASSSTVDIARLRPERLVLAAEGGGDRGVRRPLRVLDEEARVDGMWWWWWSMSGVLMGG